MDDEAGDGIVDQIVIAGGRRYCNLHTEIGA
jgi:hypothetical protein